MPKYKEMMQCSGIKQKDLLESIRVVDNRVDKPLLSKFVNNVCLPTPPQLEVICQTMDCCIYDIYERDEINLDNPKTNALAALLEIPKDKKSREASIYNLTVEIDRRIAERVFSKEALRKLGYKDRTDFVRQCVQKLVERLDLVETNERINKQKIAAKCGTNQA